VKEATSYRIIGGVKAIPYKSFGELNCYKFLVQCTPAGGIVGADIYRPH
jgi:hypothetical protein